MEFRWAESFLKKADREKVRTFLRLPKEGSMFLLMGGSMGAGDLEKLTKELLAQKKQKDFVVVICGNNKKMFQRMKKKYRQESGVILIGQTKQMDLYLKACDLIYTKPGGLTSTEAAASRTLMVHTAPIPGCETANRRFFVRRGMSIAPRTLERQVRKGRELLEKEEAQRKMREAQSRYVGRCSGEDCCFYRKNRLRIILRQFPAKKPPGRFFAGRPFWNLQRKYLGSNGEIDHNRAGIYYGGDQRSCHDGRIQVKFFCQQRQGTSDQLGEDDRSNE